MREVLQPLAMIPGVRMTALVSEDGVPIVSARGHHAQVDDDLPLDRDDELNAFTALASGWLGDLRRAAARLSWSAPRRVVLRATKSELVLLQAPTAVVLVVLERGISAEELRIPMEGALARMQRLLREITEEFGPIGSGQAPQEQPPGLLPGVAGPATPGAVDTLATNGFDPSTD